jgi:hypothetical protein
VRAQGPRLDPLKIARDENLWPQLCEKLTEAVTAQRGHER